MNAHVLRKRDLAKNLILLLLPVLVSWCQCLSAAAPSSLLPNKMIGDLSHNNKPNYVHSSAGSPYVGPYAAETIYDNNANGFRNVPKHENSQKFTYNIHNSNEKRTQQNAIHTTPTTTTAAAATMTLMSTSTHGENENLVAKQLIDSNRHHTEIHSDDRVIDRNDGVDEKSPSDFVTYGLLRKRNVNALQNRLSRQQQMKRARHDLLRNRLNHHHHHHHQQQQQRKQLRVLPKTTIYFDNHNNNTSYNNNNNSDRDSRSKSNIFPNWSNEHDNSSDSNNSSNKYEIIAIDKRNAYDQERNDDASKTTASFNNSHSNRIFNESSAESEPLHQQLKIERSRRESRSELKQQPLNGNGDGNGNALARFNPFSNSRINGLTFGNVNPPRQRRFCSARDPTTLAFEAPTVFEGKVRSMSSDRRRNFSVTFEVKEIYKRQIGLKLPPLIRLKFTYKNSSECDIYRETFRSVGHVRDELDPGKLYILFVNQIDVGNFTILGQPLKRTRKTVTDVRTGVAEKYGQRAYIESLMANNATIREGKRLRIVCKVRGHPPPKVTWFKDDRSIAKNRSKYQFVHLRRRSELIIKSAFVNDSGQYECRAKNKLARQPIRKFTRIDVLPKAPDNTRNSGWNHSGSTCPVIGNAFCLNGGTCVFWMQIGEPACKCPDGFLGNRCETKNPTNIHSSTYRNNQDIRQQQHHCGDNNFYGSYYC